MMSQLGKIFKFGLRCLSIFLVAFIINVIPFVQTVAAEVNLPPIPMDNFSDLDLPEWPNETDYYLVDYNTWYNTYFAINFNKVNVNVKDVFSDKRIYSQDGSSNYYIVGEYKLVNNQWVKVNSSPFYRNILEYNVQTIINTNSTIYLKDNTEFFPNDNHITGLKHYVVDFNNWYNTYYVSKFYKVNQNIKDIMVGDDIKSADGSNNYYIIAEYILKNNQWVKVSNSPFYRNTIDYNTGYIIDADIIIYNVDQTVLFPDYTLSATFGNQLYTMNCNDPVNAATGNFYLSQIDLSIPTRGIPLEFTRSYNSRDGYNGPIGKGWQHNYNTLLTINDDNSVSVLYPDGHRNLFTYTNGSYTRQSGCFEILTHNQDGTYTLTFKDQTRYIYNSEGRSIQILDKNDNAINLQYNGSVLSAVYEPTGRALQFFYDQNNRLTQVTDPAGRTIYFTYDADGNLATSSDLNGGITTYTYGNHGLVSITDPNNHFVVKNTYDTRSRVTEQEDGKGNETTFTYDTTNKKTTMTDPRGNTATFYYDDEYRVTKIAYPQSITSQYIYDASGNRTGETDKNGKTTNYTYDGMGNVLTRTDPAPLNYVTTYSYDNFNNPIQVIDAAGFATDYTYDAKGNLLTVSRAVYGGTATTSISYNEFGQIAGITNANGKAVQFSYDEYGNQATVTDPLGNATSYTYDIVGRKLTKTDALGHTISYTYDAAGNVLIVTDPLGNITTSTYDPKGNRTSSTDPKGNNTTFTYDPNDMLITTTNPLGKTTTFGYDSENNLISITDTNNHTTTNNYDFLNQLLSTTDPSGKTVTYTLDGNGNRITKTDRNGNTTIYTYDALNRLTKVTDAMGNSVVTEYDPLGNKTTITDQRGNVTRFTYDQGSRLLGV